MSGISLLRLGAALLSGMIFGFGLSLSGMINPERVIGFLNIASGHWDPSLAFVMGGGLLVAMPGIALCRWLAAPVLDTMFHLPTKTGIDKRLVVGSALFGAGWGLAGFCPGPAVAALSLGLPQIALFVAAMGVGMVIHDHWIAKAL